MTKYTFTICCPHAESVTICTENQTPPEEMEQPHFPKDVVAVADELIRMGTALKHVGQSLEK